MFCQELSAEEIDASNAGFSAAFNGEDQFFANPYLDNPDLAACWNDGYIGFQEIQRGQDLEQHRLKRIVSTDPVLAKLQAMDMDAIGGQIGVSVSAWHGRCYEIVSKIVDTFKWTDPEAVYGLYLGPVAAGCTTFPSRLRGTIRHGWILTREGVLVDPTAWVFLNTTPALRVLMPGSDEAFDLVEHYDEGAESLYCTGARVAFPQDSDGAQFSLGSDLVNALRETLLSSGVLVSKFTTLTLPQLAWLARMPYTSLGTTLAAQFCAALSKHDLRAIIPVEYLRRRCLPTLLC